MTRGGQPPQTASEIRLGHKPEVGEKVIVCGRSVRWWDDEIKGKIQERREVYKRIVRGEKDLWEEYNMLRREV